MEFPHGVWKGILACLRCRCGSIGTIHAYGETMCPECLVGVLERSVFVDEPEAIERYIIDTGRHSRALVSQAHSKCNAA